MTTHYDVLGVSPEASTEAIKRAYYRRARAYHPDAHAGQDGSVLDEAQQAMAGLNEAWGTLRDEALRAEYDAALAAAAARTASPARRPRVRAKPALGAGFTPWLGSAGVTIRADRTRAFNLEVDGTGDLSPLRRLAPDGLVGLHAAEAPIDDRQLRHLGGLTGLRLLDLSGTRVTAAGLVHLQALERLETLSLWDTRVDDRALPLVARLGSLRHLGLGNTGVTDEGLAHLAGLTRLRVLQLWGTDVEGPGLDVLHGLQSLEIVSLPRRVRGRHRRRLKQALPATLVA